MKPKMWIEKKKEKKKGFTRWWLVDESFHTMFDFKMEFGIFGQLLAESRQLFEQTEIRRLSEVIRKGIQPYVQGSS